MRKSFIRNFVLGAIALGAGAAFATNIALFTGPTGTNPAVLPIAIADLNTLVNNINANAFNNPALNNANILQNGDFGVDQRNEGSAVTITSGSGNLMTVDRWQGNFAASSSGAGNPTVQQVAISSGSSVTPKEAKLAMSSTAGTSAPAALDLVFQQQIEGKDVADLAWGTNGAAPVTVSFLAKSSIASTVLGVALQNGAQNRSYFFDCTTSATASTWTKCSGTIPGDTAGSWNNTRGTVGGILAITAACGSTFQGTAAAWAASNVTCDSTQTQMTNTGSSTLEIAAVKLERGSFATAFNAPPVSDEAKLLRFYSKTFPFGTSPANNAGLGGAICVKAAATQNVSYQFTFQPGMYSSPTVTTYNPSAANANWRDVTAAADLTVTVDPSTAKGLTGVELSSANANAANDNVCIHASFETSK